MPKITNRGVFKRCVCPRRNWPKCHEQGHAWHFSFFKGKKYRFSLDVLAASRGERAPRSRAEAEALADKVRADIRSGTFKDPHAPAPAPDPAAKLTVGDVLDEYEKRFVRTPGRRPNGLKTMLWHLGVLRRVEIPGAGGHLVKFADKPISAITKRDIDAIREARQAARPPGSTVGSVGDNRLLERARSFFAWAVVEGFIDATPFKRGGQTVIKFSKETPRDRRLLDGDDERLLAAASPHLRDLILAGISTGCRIGELLSLQWADVRTTTDATGQTRYTLIVRAEKSKTATMREIPAGQRLAAVLAMRRHGPDGEPFAADRFVFGNECGEQILTVRKAWMTTVLRAFGHVPVWEKGKRNHLAPESQAAYRAINLRFHDLRREFGSRILESGSSLVEARDLLGHRNISQTSTYLQSSAKSLSLAIEKKEQHEQRLHEARQQHIATDSSTTTPVLEPGQIH